MSETNRIVSSESEELILVDRDDTEIGYLSKARCHDGEGVLHRAFSLFLFNEAGKLLLQTDFKQIGDLAWNKVLLGVEQYGWIVRVSPPQMGIPEKRISQAYKFFFRYKDLDG